VHDVRVFFVLAVMSTLLLTGFLGVANGRREMTSRPGRERKEVRICHVHYTTSLQCIDGSALAAELRVYTASATEPILPDNTVAYVVAKCHFPIHEVALLDAFYLAKVPGDVNDERYEDHVPDIPIPFVFGVGQVAGEVPMSSPVLKCVAVSVSEYVRDEVKHCDVQYIPRICHLSSLLHKRRRCYFDSSKPRWTRTPSPRINSTLQFFGTCAALTTEGVIRIQVDSLGLNLGHGIAPAGAPPQPAVSSKKRKFSAIAQSQPAPTATPTATSVLCPSSYFTRS
jgi:hypothetical protein